MIYQHPEVEKFLIDLYDLYNQAMTGDAPQSNPFDKNGRLTIGRLYRPIRSTDLIGKSVFGPGYGGPSGIDCVDVIAQGPFKFKGFMTSEEDMRLLDLLGTILIIVVEILMILMMVCIRHY